MAEGFKCANDGEEFFIVNVVVKFGRLHGLGVESDRMPSVKEVGLFKDGTKGKVGSISKDTEW